MTKILRKYNKWLIAIFGSFLMVTFMLSGPQSCAQQDPARTVEGTLGGRTVRAKELATVSMEYESVKSIAPDLVQRQMNIRDGVHWLLLVTEAQRLGLVGNANDGRGMLDVLAQDMTPVMVMRQIFEEYRQTNPALAQQLLANPQIMNMLAEQRMRDLGKDAQDKLAVEAKAQLEQAALVAGREHRQRPEEVDMALAKLRGVTRLVQGYASAGRLSDKRMLQVARTQREQALADVLLIPAASFIDASTTPDEARLQTQFEKFKGVEPGKGELGSGYAQPARVKLEWMTLDRQAILGALSLDPIEVNKHWQMHRSTFTGEFAAERGRVESELKERKLEEVLAAADRTYKAKIRSETRKLETRGGIKVLPADYASQRTPMQALATAIVDGVRVGSKVEIPAPGITIKDDAWVKVPDVRTLPGIGFSAMLSGSKEVRFQDVIASLHELNPQGGMGLQTLVPFDSALIDGAGNRYYISVLASRAPSPADSLDEVRPQVVQDVLEQLAFEKLSAELASFQERAASEGLEVLATSLGARVVSGKPAPVVKRNLRFGVEFSDPSLGVEGVEPLRDAIMGQQRTLGVLTQATSENQALRTVGAAMPAKRAIAIAQLNGSNAVTVEALRTYSGRVAQDASIRELAKQSENEDVPFSFQGLSKRLDWKPVGEEKAREEKKLGTTSPENNPG
jgi:hypothetical protein